MCEYCEEYRKPLDKQGNFSVWMLGSDMVVRHSFGQTLVPINFCPMCGRKLRDDCPTKDGIYKVKYFDSNRNVVTCQAVYMSKSRKKYYHLMGGYLMNVFEWGYL